MAMIGSIGLTSGLSQNQMQQASNSLNQQPLGFVERASGLSVGLEQLERRIEGLVSRISGDAQSSRICGGEAAKEPLGLGRSLDEAEGRLRDCMSLIDDLHARF